MQKNKIKCIVFDWAGTTIDYGCRAPLLVFIENFKKIGIPISINEASQPIGMLKIDHIRELIKNERIKNEFFLKFKAIPNENNVIELNSLFEPELFKILPKHSIPIPNVLKTIDNLRTKGILIGSTTGYTKEMMNIVMPNAANYGYSPDYMISSSEVKIGRPAPFMMFNNAMNFGIFPMTNLIKVGDTLADIKEGKNAGSWTVGLLTGSSLLGLSQEEYEDFPQEYIKKLKVLTTNKYIE